MDESETSLETLHWLSQTGTLDIIAQARAELTDGQGLSESQIRAEFGARDRIA